MVEMTNTSKKSLSFGYKLLRSLKNNQPELSSYNSDSIKCYERKFNFLHLKEKVTGVLRVEQRVGEPKDSHPLGSYDYKDIKLFSSIYLSAEIDTVYTIRNFVDTYKLTVEEAFVLTTFITEATSLTSITEEEVNKINNRRHSMLEEFYDKF